VAERTGRRLDQPKGVGRRLSMPHGEDLLGRVSEGVARFFGSARFILMQTLIVIVWITLNVAQATKAIRWDPYPFILLNLAFSTQAAYAAPLILLAQSRQTDRDRVSMEEDRAQNNRSIADTEYLTREIAAVRIALGDVATRDFIRSELTRLVESSRAEEEDSPAQ
jgi:uncharacterized membrane protein